MALDNNLNLINQIVTASGLRGKDLEALKTRLSKMSEAELQRELSKALSGNNSVGDKGLVLERTGNTVVTPLASHQEALGFLQQITNEADTAFQAREKESGVMSSVVNTWQEMFNEQYARSTVQRELTTAKEDLRLLEKASKGELQETDFLGNTRNKSFEEVFKERRGVEFNSEAIEDCTEKAQEYAVAKTSVEMANKIKQVLKYTTKGDVTSQMRPQDSAKAIIKAFQFSGVGSLEEMNKALKDISEKYKNHPLIQKYGGDFRLSRNSQGEYVIYRTSKGGSSAEATNDQLRVIVDELELRINKSLATALGAEYKNNATSKEIAFLTQQTLNKYEKEYQASFKKAYGNKDVKALSEAYILKQQQGVANIEMGLNIVSMALMIIPGGAVATAGWALKGANALKVAKGIDYVNKARNAYNAAQNLTRISRITSPFIMSNMVLRPTELLEQLTSENGMSAEEWEMWGENVLENGIYMAAGMGASKLAETGAAIYKSRALVTSFKNAGKSADEIISIVKANPVKFPKDIVKSLNKIDNIAKGLQISTEVALDLGATLAINKFLNNGDLLPQDVINSVAFAISGGVLQKQFAPLATEAKIGYLESALKEYGVTRADAERILQAMDDISSGKIIEQDIIPLEFHLTSTVFDEAVTTNKNTPTQPTITERLATASAREDFVALRDEIKSMPEGAEKTALKQEYMRKYKEFSQMKIAENDVKAEAKPEEPANSPKLFTPEMSKEEVETVLKGLKNPDGSARFKDFQIENILDVYTPDKSDLLNKLLDAKYADGSIRFVNREIEIILQSCTPENVDVLNKLLEAKDSDGSIRFNGYHIKTILESYTPDKADVLNKLLEAEYSKHSSRFDNQDIGKILQFYTPDKAEILDKLSEVKNPNGSNRFDGSDISGILEYYTPDKADALNKLIEAKNPDGSAIFMAWNISGILKYYTPDNAYAFNKLLEAKDSDGSARFYGYDISDILKYYTPEKAEILTRLLSETVQDSQGNTIPRFDADIIRLFFKRPELEGKIDEIIAKVPATEYGNYALKTFLIANKDIDLEGLLKFKDLDSIIKMIQNNPERYINGTETDPYAVKIIMDDFFRHFGLYLSNLNTVLDKEAMNTLLRTRLSNVQTYLYITTGFSSKEWKLLGKLANSCNNDGKPFLPKQKIQFIDLIKAYKDNDVSFNKMEQMLETGNIDVGQLQIDLFQNVMRKSGLTEEEIAKIPNENIIQWDIQNIHLLAKSINSDKKAFDDIIRAANLEKDFVEYLHNADNVYGQANNNTQKMYADMKMDYDEWLHPSKNHEIKFTAKDKNLDKVQQIASQVEEDLNALMNTNTHVSGFLKKQFPKFIKDNKFVLPAEYTTNKAKLTEFVKLFADTSEKGQLAQVWKRAQGNSTNSNPEIAARANNTLTILNHLEQRVKDIESVQEIQSTKTIDITIKMWDRVPQKDLFQGNYSTCCIGMSDSNASAMPHFIMDTSYNMIELVDNNSGDVIGNALCYFVKGEDGKPAFIIDNIEINNAHKPSDEIGADLRDHIAAYAARVAKDVTGADNTPIYMSSSYNDVPISDLKSSTQEVSFLGDIDCDEIYMDLYKGWVDKKNLTRKVGLLKVEPALVKEDYGTNFAKRLEMGTIKPIPEGLLNVKISDVIVRDGDNVSLKPEYEKQLWIIAENIRDNALKMEDKIVKLIEDNNFIIADAEFKHRPKSLQSLYDKLKNYALEINKDTGTLKNIDKTLGNAKTSVKDAVGVRVIAPSKDYSNHPEVKALLAAGKKNEAIALATEMQSKEIVANLKRISEDENHELKLINISNYKSEKGVPYAKAEDVEYLKYHGSDTTSKSGKDDKSIRDDLKGETKTESESSNNFERTKVRDSGYTALQFNFKIGEFIFEFQFRGKEVDEFAEGEHIPYDLRTGKDIIGKDTQLKVLYEPMKELLRVLKSDSTETVGMTDVQYKTYEGYLSKYYEYLRGKELGIAIDKPKFPTGDFPRDKRLMAENLIILHNIAERLKKNEITPTEALQEYQSKMVELE